MSVCLYVLKNFTPRALRHWLYVKKYRQPCEAADIEEFGCGRRWIRTTEGNNQQIYSLPHLATLEFAQ